MPKLLAFLICLVLFASYAALPTLLIAAKGPAPVAASAAEDLDAALAEEYILAGDYEDAEDMFAEATGELDRELALWKARLLRETGRGSEAVAFLRERAEFTAGDAAFQTMVGGLLEAQGDHAGAETAFTRAIESDPKSVEARARLGMLLIERGKK